MKDSTEYLKHIRDECRYLTDLANKTGMGSFLANEDLKRASVRSLEIIGEATKKAAGGFPQEASGNKLEGNGRDEGCPHP